MPLTQARLKQLLHYDASTGGFTWLVDLKKVKTGDVAGCVNSRGYRLITVDQVSYRAHRLVILYVHGYMPENLVDHIDRNRDNNRISNLREVSNQCNSRNCKVFVTNTSGVTGVCWYKNENSWGVRVYVNRKMVHFGYFKDFEEAACMRLAAEQCLGFPECDGDTSAKARVNSFLNKVA